MKKIFIICALIIILPTIILLTNYLVKKINNYEKSAIDADNVYKTIITTEEYEETQYDPWGVWNERPFTEYMITTTFSTGSYYEEFPALYIVKHCNEGIPLVEEYDFPAFIYPSLYTQIEKYEPIRDGFIFYAVGTGRKNIPGETVFQDNTRIQVKMHFINQDECYFKFVSFEDENGFYIGNFVKEDIIYKRVRSVN